MLCHPGEGCFFTTAVNCTLDMPAGCRGRASVKEAQCLGGHQGPETASSSLETTSTDPSLMTLSSGDLCYRLGENRWLSLDQHRATA